MASSATLATLRVRVAQLLYDVANAVFTTGVIDEGIRLALEEYSRAYPLRSVGTLAGVTTREPALASLTGLVSVWEVWFPYTAAAPEYPPRLVEFDVLDNAGTLTLLLFTDQAPNGESARVFYNKAQTLNGLDGAAATTFEGVDDGLLVLGGAGYSCLSRSAVLTETATYMAISTPNYGALADIFLFQFRSLLSVLPRRERHD